MPNEENTIVINAYPTLKEQTASMALGLGFTVVVTAAMIGGLALVGWAAEKASVRRARKEQSTK